MHIRSARTYLFSIILAGASFREGEMRGERDGAGACLRFYEQMSQVASTGPLGTLSPGPSGFPVTGFFIAVTSAGLFLLAALAVLGIWIPFAWWRTLTIAGAVVSILLMLMFFGPTKILPFLVDLILIYFAWNNLLPGVK